MTEINPEMLILARESRGMIQADLAADVGITQGKLSKYESGLLRVSDTDIEAIAQVLAFPVGFFSLNQRMFGYGTSCLFHRKLKSLPVRDHNRELARINILRIRLSILLRSTEIKHPYTIERLDIDEIPDGAIGIARAVRALWNLKPGPILNLTQTLEAAGAIIHFTPFHTDRIDAISQWIPGEPPLLFMNSNMPGDRMRWSMAHELGHLIMHRLPTPDPEQEADDFAREFLIPSDQIRSQLSDMSWNNLLNLKLYWKVSIASLIRCAASLGTISQQQYSNMFKRLSQAKMRKNEPGTVDQESPKVVKDLLSAHLNGLGYTVAQIAEILHCNIDDITEDFNLASSKPTIRLVR